MDKTEHPFDFMLHTKLGDFAKGTGKIVAQTAEEREAAQLRQIETTEKLLNKVGLSMRSPTYDAGEEESVSEEKKALRFSKDAPDEVKAFLLEIAEVSKRHGLSISHQDIAGAFVVEKYDPRNIQWLCFASYNPEEIALDYWDCGNDEDEE